MTEVFGEVQKVRSTIKEFLELIRDIFDADVCYLYLVSNDMDPDEKKDYFDKRISDIRIAYSERKLNPPNEQIDYNLKNSKFKMLKFIDIAEKDERKKHWNFDYKNRPEKYVVFEGFEADKPIYGEGLTAFIARTKKTKIFNNKIEIDKHGSSAFLNHKNKIADPCEMMIGFPLIDKKINGDSSVTENLIGVLKIENYHVKGIRKYKESDEVIKEVETYLNILVKLIKSSKNSFSRNSYEELYGGINLLNCLKEIEPSKDKLNGEVNRDIWEITLHLFFVLKRKEYVGHEEILDRVAAYVNDVAELCKLESTIQSVNNYLEEFKKHEELLLYGLKDYRDHFMHQFHVFVTGYIIINKMGIDKFKSILKESTRNVLNSQVQNIEIEEEDVLRIWFFTALFHDSAYLLEKINTEISGFFNKVLGYPFSVKFDWERLLEKESEFPQYLINLLDFFASSDKTNSGTLLRNYLDAIIVTHDHAVLSALLLIKNYSMEVDEKIVDQCYFAAFAISLHNEIYADLREGDEEKISFESFPMAFLLAYCDTAQSFGRVEKKDDKKSSDFPVMFFDIKANNRNITYELKYTSKYMKNIPSETKIRKWSKGINKHFISKNYSFEIRHYSQSEKKICTLHFK